MSGKADWAKFRWEPGFEDATTPFELGYAHGHEDIGVPFRLRPGCVMTKAEYQNYAEGYRTARKEWIE